MNGSDSDIMHLDMDKRSCTGCSACSNICPVQCITMRADAEGFLYPVDFLRYFRDAEYVITNSFHGTCFSIIFEKKFYSLIKECGEVRINSLLSKLSIEDRIIHDPSEVSTNEICFERCREVISKERDRAREYIKEIIHE